MPIMSLAKAYLPDGKNNEKKNYINRYIILICIRLGEMKKRKTNKLVPGVNTIGPNVEIEYRNILCIVYTYIYNILSYI